MLKRTPPKKTRAPGNWRRVADALQKDIIFGRLPPTKHVTEEEIMESFGASRHAARRAFEELDRSGLLVRLPNRGARVRSYSAAEVEDLYEIRETLEMRAAMRIRLPASAELVEKLNAIEAEHQRAADRKNIVALFETNDRFHDALYRAGGNYALADAIRLFAWQSYVIRIRFITEESWRRNSVNQHKQMIRLLTQGTNQELAQLVYEHLQPSKQFYIQLYYKLKAG